MSQARAIAADLLNRLQDRRYTLDHLLEQADSRILRLNRADRSLVHALVFGVQRWQGRLDWIIDHLAARKSKIDPHVRTILRLGLFQIQFLERIPASAAVHRQPTRSAALSTPYRTPLCGPIPCGFPAGN
ncbi:MAG: transcription antitermination factor NusB [Desulfobacteraceae bacterium]